MDPEDPGEIIDTEVIGAVEINGVSVDIYRSVDDQSSILDDVLPEPPDMPVTDEMRARAARHLRTVRAALKEALEKHTGEGPIVVNIPREES